jgi:hypothetical protein
MCSAGARLGALLAAALLVVGCQDAVDPNGHQMAPKKHRPDTTALAQVGPEPAISGLGTLGSGDTTAGSDLQQFDFDVKSDLTGRFF